MAERKEEADGNGPLALLHQLARDVVDGRDVVGIDGVAKAERVGEECGADQDRIIMESDQRPNPGQHIGDGQHDINTGDLDTKSRILIVEQFEDHGPQRAIIAVECRRRG